MVRLKTTFDAADSMTPDLAALLTQLATKYDSALSILIDGRIVRIESLISILSIELRRGTPIEIIAEGGDENAAAQDVRALVEGH